MVVISIGDSPIIRVLLTATMLCIAGCGKSDQAGVSAMGKVTINSDTVPAGSILVWESEDASISRTATIDDAGGYSLSGASAIPVGTYKISITPPKDKPSTDFPVPEKFRSTSTTTKTVEIKSGESTYDIDFSG